MATAQDSHPEALVALFPWKPSLALFRALECRGVRRHGALLSSPILDLGCGDGEINRLFLAEYDSVGIDWDPAPLPKAKQLVRRVARADARRLPFRSGSFGAVFGNCAIEHFPDVDLCLAEAGRVLRDGGTFIATVPSAHWKNLYVWNRFFSTLGFPRLGRKIVDAHDREVAHRNLFGVEEWTVKLRCAGLEPVAFDPYLTRRGALFTTFLESVLARPFPFPGFWTHSGTLYFLSGVLRRLGGERFWKQAFVRLIRPFYEEAVGPDGVAAGIVLVARKERSG
jgi:SAM-dependent methyltransferase